MRQTFWILTLSTAVIILISCHQHGVNNYSREKIKLTRSSYDVQEFYRRTNRLPSESDLKEFEADGIIPFQGDEEIDFAVFMNAGSQRIVLFQTNFYLIGETELEGLRGRGILEVLELLTPKKIP